MFQRKQGDRRRGDHYFHSSYCDLVLSGLVGLHVVLRDERRDPWAETAAQASVLQASAEVSAEASAEALLVVEPLLAESPCDDAAPPPAAEGIICYFVASAVRVRGHEVAVTFDAQGARRYGVRGLAVWLDGRMVAHARKLRRLVVPLSTGSGVVESLGAGGVS